MQIYEICKFLKFAIFFLKFSNFWNMQIFEMNFGIKELSCKMRINFQGDGGIPGIPGLPGPLGRDGYPGEKGDRGDSGLPVSKENLSYI
jgi:hypothetical protein